MRKGYSAVLASVLGALLLGLTPTVSWAEGIVDVLQRSQAQRLAQLSAPTAGEPSAEAVACIEASFQTLLSTLDLQQAVSLRVVRGVVLAETLQGRVVVVDESLAALPEAERLFVLAHELGHVALRHWAVLGQLYERLVPGEVMRMNTDPVANLLGQEASELSHQHEFDADAYGLQALHKLGHGRAEVLSLFMRLGVRRDTATHPSSRKRVAHLNQLD